MQRVLDKDASALKSYNDLPADKKREIIANAHGKVGQDLQLVLHDTLHKNLTKKHSVGFISDGTYKDEKDIRDMYPNSEDIVKAILSPDDYIACPVRRVRMYMVPIYKRVQKDEVEDLEEETTHMEGGERKRKATKQDPATAKTT